MRLAKTELGIQAMKDRSIALTARQRGAFILCDARHTKEHVLASARRAGVTDSDVQYLLEQGLIEEIADPADIAAQAAAESLRARPPMQRYSEAYPIAIRLTSSLGLRGFRLNMAVERASNYAELCAVAPALKDALDERQYAELHSALFA